MSLDPRLRNFLRVGLIGCGALAVGSSVINIVAVWKLIDPSAEASLGITRGEWISTYGTLLLIGGAMVLAGLRWKK